MDSNRRKETSGARRGRLRRLALAPLRLIVGVALRVAVTSVVFLVCTAVTLRLLGYELPWPSDFEQYFEGVEKLSDILS